MEIDKIRGEVDQIYEDVVALRRHLHMHPELSQQEEQTMAFVSDYLTGLNIPHQTNVGGHGIVAIIGDPKASFAVAIRADMDALPVLEQTGLPYASQNPGVMHACGHDVHTAILMGTARVLKGMESELPGAVKLFFQPAEEKGGGAKPMIEAGCLQDPPVKRVMGLHVDPAAPVGKVTFFNGPRSASSTTLHITINGRSCHGAQPQTGADAILAGAHVVTALQQVVSRSVAPTCPVVLTIGQFNGGTRHNIVAGKVEMSGTLRTLDLAVRDLVKERIHQVAEDTAVMYGATADVEIHDGYLPVITDLAATQRMMEVAKEALGAENVILAKEPVMTSEDFCFFLDEVPGTFFDLGTTALDCAWPQTLHNDHFAPNESCIKTGILLEVLGALAFLKECE
ncbi:MAG: amidohydrolase [Clostridia bacterium]|nr:amidohydrolase [Clostridia bacterium]